jgi:hypothetical protein
LYHGLTEARRHSDKRIFSFAADGAKDAHLSEWALKSLHMRITAGYVSLCAGFRTPAMTT